MASDTPTLFLATRTPGHSRAARRLRRTGLVPGVIYGGEGEPVHFQVDARTLRNTLARSGAILQVSLDGGDTAPALVKETQRHPVRGDTTHVDLLRVNMRVAVQSTAILDLVGAERAPGVVQGGVLDQVAREVHIEALPGDLPESIQFDVSGLEMNERVTLADVPAPEGVTFLDDPETVVVSITAPTAEPSEDEIELETQLVGGEVVGDAAADVAAGATQEEAGAADSGTNE